MKKPPESPRPGSPQAIPSDEAFASAHPALWEYLTAAVWDDGSPRQTATLLSIVEEGLWKVCLNDRALERSAWASGPTWAEALASLEAKLDDGTVEWRKRPPQPPTRRR